VKTAKTLYWIVTSVTAAFMLLASIPDVLRLPQAVSIFGHLGYPVYLLPFLGAAKTLGIVAILVPGFQRLKEWAYAGLVFDVIGALYSHLSVGDSPSGWMPALIGLVLVGGSYLSYRRQLISQDGPGRARSASPGDVNNVLSTSRAAVEAGNNPRTVGIR
jgi:DoxX-like family